MMKMMMKKKDNDRISSFKMLLLWFFLCPFSIPFLGISFLSFTTQINNVFRQLGA